MTDQHLPLPATLTCGIASPASTDPNNSGLASVEILVSVPTKFAPFIRPNKQASLRDTADDEVGTAVFKGTRATEDPLVSHLHLQSANPVINIAVVSAAFRFEMYERISPSTTRRDWSYPTAPRGSDAERFGLLKKRSGPVARAPNPISNPFLLPRDDRPSRVPAGFEPHKSVNKPERHSLSLSVTEWSKWKISTVAFEDRYLVPEWRLRGLVKETAADSDHVSIYAAVQGTFHPAALRRNNAIRAGDPVGDLIFSENVCAAQDAFLRLSPDARKASSHSRALMELGLLPSEIADISATGSRIACRSLLTPVPGIIDSCLTEPREVAHGDKLLRLRAANMRVVQCRMSVEKFGLLPKRVSLEVRKIQGNNALHQSADVPILNVSSDPLAEVSFELPIPSDLSSLLHGYVVDITLTAPNDIRRRLAIPQDCVTRVLQSSEILVHTGPGRLTPISVSTGFSSDGYIEILDQISPGLAVVRDLTQLAKIYPDVTSIVTGFWNPQEVA